MRSNRPASPDLPTAQSSCPHCCNAKIGPSLLACNLARLTQESTRVLEAGADYLHLDVMDGHFVPNITWGAPVIKCLRKEVPHAFFDCHMMVAEPERWVQDIKDAGGDQFTFHLESTTSPKELIEQIHSTGMKAGMAVKPGTPVEACVPFVELVEMVLVMTVEPGFGGQSFMAGMMPKVSLLRNRFPSLDIEVDGGLSPGTIDVAAKAGANMIVAGSAVFKPEPGAKETIAILRRSVEKHGNGKDEEELTELPSQSKTTLKRPFSTVGWNEYVYGENLGVGASQPPSVQPYGYGIHPILAWGFT